MTSQKREVLLPRLVAGGLLLLFLVGAALLLRTILSHKVSAPKRTVETVVRIIRPPPQETPPPPPPPEKVEEPIPKDMPDKTPDQQPQPDVNQQLGLDAQGSAGGDDFGLAARHGGADLIGGSNDPFGSYTSKVKQAVLEILSDDQRVRKGSYDVVVRIWLTHDGAVSHCALTRSSGSRDKDRAIEQDIARVGRIAEAPPIEMPEPVILRIVSKG